MKTRLLFRLFACFMLIFSSIGIDKVYADHISSAELFVDYIGTGPTDMKYKVTLVFYRICQQGYVIGQPNLQLGPTESGVSVHSTNLNYTKLSLNMRNIELHKDANGNPVYEDTVDNLCPAYSAVNSCRVFSNFAYSGYTTRTYVDTVVVPGRSSDLQFVWSSCCRLLAYTNIVAGGSSYIEAGINNLVRYNNSSPRYQALPFTFCCTNQPSSFSNVPNDPDGDSLVTYKFDPQTSPFPLFVAAPGNVTYNPGYSFASPVGTSGYYSVGRTSGKASFLATASGKFSLAYRTEDWDRASGQRLGYVTRDVAITVLPCTNLPPTIDSIPQGVTGVRHIDTANGEVILTACPQSPLSFVINSHSNNTNGLIYMRPNSVLPAGMTVVPTITGGTGYVTVNWTPTAAQIGSYTVSILAVDSTCAVGQEITLRSEFTFTVVVRPGLDAGPDLTSCPLGERPVRLGSNANPTSTITWLNLAGNPGEYLTCTSCPNPLANPPFDYTYVVHTNDPSYVCKAEDTVVVRIDRTNSVEAPQDVLIVCRPDYVTLQANATGPAPLANLPCGTVNPISCSSADQKTATIGGGINPAALPPNTPFNSINTYHKYQFIIPKRSLLNAGLYSGTINSIAFLHVNPTVLASGPLQNLTISLGCVAADTLPANANNASFFTTAEPVATLASYALTANAWNQINFTKPYSWDTTLNLLVDICMGPLNPTTQYGLDPVAMMPGRVIQKFSSTIDVCSGSVPTVQSYPQQPIVQFNYCPSPELPFQYYWQPGTYLNDSNVQNPRAYIPRSVNYAVYTVGRNGCRVRDSLHIVIPEHHLQVGPQDTIACRNQVVPLFATGGAAYQWFEVQGGVFADASASLTCTNCANPVATPPVTTTYAVVFSNDINRGNPLNPGSDLGCPDTLFTTVIVNQLPPVRITNRDTTIGYGKHVQLFAKGSSRYSWSPVGSLSDPNSPAPVASPKETTNYIVAGMDANGCVYHDTVKVTVDYASTLLIPSAFTPNNDGRNDVFKIVNVNFQRLMEFRVFNRWGQEVFSTQDINEGWDGKWKGVDQNIGNYQYIIRVGFPDGNVETYKGDINLIR